MKRGSWWIVAGASAVLASCHTWGFNRPVETPVVSERIDTSGLRWEDVRVGTGPEVRPNSRVSVDYVGRLLDGKQFDSSYDRGVPLECTLGKDKLLPGWERGLQGMRAGGKRVVTVPPELAFGAEGRDGEIPPNATLVFEIELIEVEQP